jgi:CubicO group peptidase (beta-lactamase class C family)
MGKLDDKIDAVFADMDMPQHPGAALLVIAHDEIVYRKCYGLADLETQRTITADSSFYLGSISKQFTAMAIMLLAEQGRLSYDDRLPAFVPQFPSWGTEIITRRVRRNTFHSSAPAKRPSNGPARSMASPMSPCSNGPWT